MKALTLLSALTVLSSVVGYRVLVVTPVPSRSHGNLAKGIVDSLLDAGHEVAWLSPYTDWKPRKGLRIIDGSATTQLISGVQMTQPKTVQFVKEFAANISLLTVRNKELRETLVNDKYDAVVTEWFFSDLEAGYAAVQQVPWIMLSGMHMHLRLEFLIDEIRSLSTVPLMFNDQPMPMGFLGRVWNTIMFGLMEGPDFLTGSSAESLYKSHFSELAAARGVTLQPYKEAIHNVSVLLVNSHPSVAPALSLPPNVVYIGGYHIDEGQSKTMPEDIKQLLDSHPEGVVYFSMGSVVKGAELPISLRQDLIKILGDLPYLVLWKFEEELSGLPKNVIVKKWWPQAGVLAHPNVKLFITHGGLLSMLETVHYGVPLLAMPVFGDQPTNAASAVRLGFAQQVPYSPTMGPGIKQALSELLSNDAYYNRAKYLSMIFNKRPVHPRKLISHYTELAIESKGAYHLRSKAHLYAWYQRWMLDQLAALIALLYALYKAITLICCRGQKTSKKLKKN